MEYMQITDKLNKLIKGINVEVLLEHVPNPEHKQKGKLWLRPDGKAEFFPAVYIYRFLLPTGNGGVTFISEDYVFWARSFSATTYGYITSELFCYPKSSKKVQYANLKYKNVAFLLGIKDLYGIYHSDFKSIFSDKRMFFCDGISFEAFSASKRNKFTVHVKTESLDLEVKPWMLCGDAFSCLYVETMPEDVLGMRLTMKEVMNGSISDPELSYIPLYLTQITVHEY